jgi:ribose transport system permease protein
MSVTDLHVGGVQGWASRRSSVVANWFGRSYLLYVMAAVLVAGWVISPHFLTYTNMMNVLSYAGVLAIMAVGEFLVIVVSGIDLSVGSVAALTTCIAAVVLQAKLGIVLAVVAGLAIAGVCGAINGIVTIWLKIPALISTLAMMYIAVGVAYLIQYGSLIQVTDPRFLGVFSGSVDGFPSPVIWFIGVGLVAGFIMKFTAFGRGLYAIGGNQEASRLSGLPVARSVFLTYVVCALLAGLAGLVLAAELQQGSPLLGGNYNLDAIAAVVVGGASLFGGTGSPIAAAVGAIILSGITNILDLMGMPPEPQYVVEGIVLLVAVFFITGDGVRIVRSVGKRAVVGIRGAGAASGGRANQAVGTGLTEIGSTASREQAVVADDWQASPEAIGIGPLKSPGGGVRP